MPHSLTVSKAAVCLYLQSKATKLTDKIDANAQFLSLRIVDDMIILSTKAESVEFFFESLAKNFDFNQKKLRCSVHIKPEINTGSYEDNMNIAGCELSPDLKNLYVNPRPNSSVIPILDYSVDVNKKFEKKCFGLVKFYTSTNVIPPSIMNSAPSRFVVDWFEFLKSIFKAVATRYAHLAKHLLPKQRTNTITASLFKSKLPNVVNLTIIIFRNN